MIIGIGSDIIDIRRIERTLDRYGRRFIDRIYTPIEQRKSEGRYQRAASYAKRFAAKEACAKALGTGFRNGIFWRDMGVVNLPSGKPTMQLAGGPHSGWPRSHPWYGGQIDLSITDDHPQAQAIVIISAIPNPDQA
jgi:holo-[acyl-carrier protein] synthase